MKPARTQPMAHGYVGNIESSFVDCVEGVPRYVKGMKIWIRRWDGKPVFGGMFGCIFDLSILYNILKKWYHFGRKHFKRLPFIVKDEYP